MTGSSSAQKGWSHDSVKFSVFKTGQLLFSPCRNVQVTNLFLLLVPSGVKTSKQLIITAMGERTDGGWNAEEAGARSVSVDTVWSGHGHSCSGS